MDDPRFQQFFVDPQHTPQRRYEAIRAVLLEGQPLQGAAARFGFAYGTLTNHAESGEELFEVVLDPTTQDVLYRIRAISWPQALLTRFSQPIVRLLQARFRRDSGEAMMRAVADARSPIGAAAGADQRLR